MKIKKKPAGAPPKYHTDEQVHQLGKELLEWLKDSNNDVWHLSDWYYGVKEMLYPEWEALRHRVEFLQYYKSAVQLMGTLMMKNTKMPTAYGSRFLNIYFAEVREIERQIAFEKIDHEAEVKAQAEANKGVSPNDKSLDALIHAVKALSGDK